MATTTANQSQPRPPSEPRRSSASARIRSRRSSAEVLPCTNLVDLENQDLSNTNYLMNRSNNGHHSSHYQHHQQQQDGLRFSWSKDEGRNQSDAKSGADKSFVTDENNPEFYSPRYNDRGPTLLTVKSSYGSSDAISLQLSPKSSIETPVGSVPNKAHLRMNLRTNSSSELSACSAKVDASEDYIADTPAHNDDNDNDDDCSERSEDVVEASPQPISSQRIGRLNSMHPVRMLRQTSAPDCMNQGHMELSLDSQGAISPRYPQPPGMPFDPVSLRSTFVTSPSPRSGAIQRSRVSSQNSVNPRSDMMIRQRTRSGALPHMDRTQSSLNSESSLDGLSRSPNFPGAFNNLQRIRSESIGSHADQQLLPTYQAGSTGASMSPYSPLSRSRPSSGRSVSQNLPVFSKVSPEMNYERHPGSPNPFSNNAMQQQQQSFVRHRRNNSSSSAWQKDRRGSIMHSRSQTVTNLPRPSNLDGLGSADSNLGNRQLGRSSSFRCNGATPSSVNGISAGSPDTIMYSSRDSSSSQVFRSSTRPRFQYVMQNSDETEASTDSDFAYDAVPLELSPRNDGASRRPSRINNDPFGPMSRSPMRDFDEALPGENLYIRAGPRSPREGAAQQDAPVSPRRPLEVAPPSRQRLRRFNSSKEIQQVSQGAVSEQKYLDGPDQSSVNSARPKSVSFAEAHDPNATAASSSSAANDAPAAPSAGDDGSDEKTYKLGALLGSGTFGEVFRALNLETGCYFAVKVISKMKDASEEEAAKIHSEIAVMKDLHHPNIVEYLGSHINATTGALEISLELVTGGSLQQMYKEFGPIRMKPLKRYAQNMVKGISYLHSKGIIHRDIKAANVLVSAEGVAMLADFGTSKQLGNLTSDTLNKSLAQVRGSVPWMSPEVVCQRGASSASDIWSLGCTVLECCQACAPWHGIIKDQVAGLWTIGNAKEHPPFPTNIESELKSFLESCLMINPDDRLSASELLEHPFLKNE